MVCRTNTIEQLSANVIELVTSVDGEITNTLVRHITLNTIATIFMCE